MPTIVAPSRSMRSISAAVSSLGPDTAPYTPPSRNTIRPRRAPARQSARRCSEYGCVKSAWTTCWSPPSKNCLLYTSDAADERSSVDLGGRRIIKKKKNKKRTEDIKKTKKKKEK